MFFRSCLLLVLLLVFKAAGAQVSSFPFTRLTAREGLPHNQINCVFKDKKGFVWVGTMAGLARFDGYSFKVFQHKFKDTTTISDNDVRNIMEGPEGNLWIETRAGIGIYNPSLERFDRSIWDDLRKYSINENVVRAVKKDSKGSFWFISSSTGVYNYNPSSNKTTTYKHVVKQENSVNASPVIDLEEGFGDNIWLIHADGVLEALNRTSGKVSTRIALSAQATRSENDTYNLFIDREGLIWIFDDQTSSGVYCFDPAKKNLVNLNKNSSALKLNSNIVTGVTQDKSGKIWVATDHGGVNLIDKKNQQVTYIQSSEDSDKSLSQNNISTIYCDDLGTVWVGTYRRGINYYHPGVIKFNLVRHSTAANSLVYNDVNDLVEDASGNLWIGTNGKGLVYYNRKDNSFRSFRHNPADPNSLSHDAIVGLYLDKAGKLWVGTYTGGLDCFNGQTFTHYRNNPADPSSLSDNRVSYFLEDSQNRFWIATMGGGVDLFDRKSGKFRAFTEESKDVSSNYVFKIFEDSHKNLWFGTGYGLNVLPYHSRKFKSVLNNAENENSLINNSINAITEDKHGNIWIGTREGLSILNPRTNKFSNFTLSNGLPDNNIQEIQSDRFNNFWLSTSNGLSMARVSYRAGTDIKFKNFDENDGLQGKEFNRNASLLLKSGELAFGGTDGLNIFNPAQIKTINNPSKLLITGFQLFNKDVEVGRPIDGYVVLKKSISETREVILKNYQNVFTIEFASLNYIEPHKVKHEYMMEGFDKNWINSDNNIRKATYTNLDPGNYVFKVRASDTDGQWTQAPVELHIKILPPFYQSTLAYMLYFLAFAGGLYLLRQRGIQKLRLQFEAEQEKKEVQRLLEQEKLESQRLIEQERVEAMRFRELDALKIKFLTNISHEFRTPLSLILAPIDKMLKQAEEKTEVKEQVSMIQRNARRLLNLVNQLLDFRRMELKELNLQKRNGNLVHFVKDIAFSFKDIAEQKGIQLSFNTVTEELNTAFDFDKLERILFNLLSNAFKFTLENGKVNVSVDLTEDKTRVEIKVRDTGIGIAKDKQEKIFESFFQNELPESIINQGSGIGLSIAKEFAKLHGGDILIESELNFGSCFTVVLPVEEALIEEIIPEVVEEVISEEKQPEETLKQADFKVSSKKLTVLIVEDDADFRFYLKDNLKEDFNVIEAGNGRDGWQKALFYHPNIVVSDISMPEMNGVDLCKKIKNDNRTFHIPVILLTAISGEEQQIAGLESGANDYMTKPFSFEILYSKMRNILKQQESFKKTYQKQIEVKPVEVEVESQDEKFLQEVVKIVEKNISNVNFSVDELSNLLFVSRVTLYKRIVNITGKTPLEFIKSYRLKRAAQLLEKGDFTVSQVCYKVGFKTPKNFVKSFKAEFDVIPSKYVESKELSGEE